MNKTDNKMSRAVDLLAHHGIKATPNRILVVEALVGAERPMSMSELENRILTIDKSNVFRTLTLFKAHHLVHAFEDGSDTVRYELCLAHDAEDDDDMHVHFFCERCQRTFCLYDTPVPAVDLPGGYSQQSVNYMIKGLCPDCARKAALYERT